MFLYCIIPAWGNRLGAVGYETMNPTRLHLEIRRNKQSGHMPNRSSVVVRRIQRIKVFFFPFYMYLTPSLDDLVTYSVSYNDTMTFIDALYIGHTCIPPCGRSWFRPRVLGSHALSNWKEKLRQWTRMKARLSLPMANECLGI